MILSYTGPKFLFKVIQCFSLYYSSSSSSSSSSKLLGILATMPKVNSPRILETQKQRMTKHQKSKQYAPSIVYLQVIGSGAKGAPASLYMFTDHNKYLFNCGEGTQRLSHEHKVKLASLQHVFITRKTWSNIGGLPGLSLTLQDVGVPEITLHGPEGLEDLYVATRRFVTLKDMKVSMADCSAVEDYSDSVMSVKYVLMSPKQSIMDRMRVQNDSENLSGYQDYINDNTDYYLKDGIRAKLPEIHKNKTETSKLASKLYNDGNCSVAFICTLKKRLGTLDLEKCVAAGVKPGPRLGQLKEGKDVVLPGGKVVRAKDVKSPDDPGPVFIVLDVPCISYLDESQFSKYFDREENPPENVPALIVHFTPQSVMKHERYKAFMTKFGLNCQHLILNEENSCLGSEAVHKTQHKLHVLDRIFFPILGDKSLPEIWGQLLTTEDDSKKEIYEEIKNKVALVQFQRLMKTPPPAVEHQEEPTVLEKYNNVELKEILPKTLTTFHLRPKKELDRTLELELHVDEYIKETLEVDGFLSVLRSYEAKAEKIRKKIQHMHPQYPRVLFLGTGSCIPSKTRNTSGIVVMIDENKSIILDCGEGTYTQLVRFFGLGGVKSFLTTLKAVYVSHLHADHHIGLIGLLQGHQRAIEELGLPYVPVYLIAPGQIMAWLSIYDHHFEKILTNFALIPNQSLLYNDESKDPISPAVLSSLGLNSIQTCLVDHCPNAFGVSIVTNKGEKITYSGDTVPCQQLVDIGRDSTLLIHEATMEDDLELDARMKMHSTCSQAIGIGQNMGAQHVLLTHFSQRYARLPRIDTRFFGEKGNVGVAYDNMMVSLLDLKILPHMYYPLQVMFAEHFAEMEYKAENRALKRERLRSLSPSEQGRQLKNTITETMSRVDVNKSSS